MGAAVDLRRTLSPRDYRRVAYAALVFCTLIVFTGAAVRLTGSGLGCHDWPKCTSTRLVPQLQTHGLIEFANRVMTTIVAVPCLLAAILAWRRRPFRRDLAWIALLLPLGVVGQAVLGGLTVLYGLDPGWVIAHFLLSMALLVAAVTLAWRATYEPGERPRSADGVSTWGVRALNVIGAVTIAAGTIATAAGPHAGGEGTHDIVPRLRWRGADTLTWAVHQHGALATLLGLSAVGLWFLLRARGANGQTRDAVTAVCVLVACQGLVGSAQYALHLPAEMVWFHVVLAALTWLALLWATAAAGRLAPRRERAPAAARAPELVSSR
jgi:cytochrome c oxidase assembly protein subunit 15